MSTHKLIVKQGYTIIATSYCNDGDDYQVGQITVDTKEEAETVVNICNLFKYDAQPRIANIYDANEWERQLVVDALLSVPNITKLVPELLTEEYEPFEIMVDLLSELKLRRSEYFTACCTSVEVYYYPENIWVELINDL